MVSYDRLGVWFLLFLFIISNINNHFRNITELTKISSQYMFHETCVMYISNSLFCDLHLEWAIIMQMSAYLIFIFIMGLCKHD